MNPHKNKDVAYTLLQKAKEDEQTVELIRVANGPWGVGCFHCQQAAEKRLKAVLAIYEGEFPRTHDIDMLISLAKPYCAALSNLPDEVLLLGDYAVGVRYDDVVSVDEATFDDNRKWLQLIKDALETLDMEREREV